MKGPKVPTTPTRRDEGYDESSKTPKKRTANNGVYINDSTACLPHLLNPAIPASHPIPPKRPFLCYPSVYIQLQFSLFCIYTSRTSKGYTTHGELNLMSVS